MFNREDCDTLTAAALAVAARKPDAIAFEYLSIRAERTALSYGNLVRKSLSVASALLKLAKPGDRVLLPCFNEIDFHIGFFACLFARCIAVPTHAPRVKRKLPEAGLSRFRYIAEDSQATVLLAPSALLERIEPYFHALPGLQQLQVLAIETAVSSMPLARAAIVAEPDDVAYLQYTSGSTSDPKGVVITQRCIVNNQKSMAEQAQLDESITSVSWLPLYHDMGLTLGCMLGIWLNVQTVILSPFVFIAKPELWLQEISGRRNVLAGGPNFCYSHCIAKVSPALLAELDLSGWLYAVNGAEPLSAATLYHFADKFAESGFIIDNFHPAYGMAEATLYVVGGRRDQAAVIRCYDKEQLKNNCATRAPHNAAAVELVGSGAVQNDAVVIVDAATLTPLHDGRIGELWINSNSAGKGYWGKPQQSADVFGHVLADYPGRRFFRSGDLGFIDGGELFVTGRIKEMIIVHGANYYPHDIERIAKTAHADLAPLMAAAFVNNHSDHEGLTLAIECPPKWDAAQLDAVMLDIRGLISAEFQLKLDNIYLLPVGSVPRTTSGKIQRKLCSEKIASGELLPIADLASSAMTVGRALDAASESRREASC